MQQRQNNKMQYLKLFALIILAVLALLPLRNLKVDYDFEAMFPNESGELDKYYSFRNQFGYDNEFVFVVLENKNKTSIFDSTFLRKADTLGKVLSKIENIRTSYLVTQIVEPDLSSEFPSQRPLLHLNDKSLLQQDSSYLFSGHPIVGSLIAKNGKSLALYFEHKQGISKKKSDALAQNMLLQCNQLGFPEAKLVGRIFAQQVYIDLITNEFILFSILSALVVMLVLFFTFRTWRGILFPLLIVGLANYFTLATMALLGAKIGLLSAIMPIMIFITGMSDVVHFYEAYLENRKSISDNKLLFKKIFKEVVLPTFYTLATTVVGFLSLLFSTMQPVREFGIYTSVGITFAFLLTILLLPILLQIFPEKYGTQAHSHEENDNKLLQLLNFVLKNGKKISLITTVISVLIISSVYRLKENHLIIDDLKADVPLKTSVEFINTNYSGIRPLEIDIKCKSIWSEENLKAIDKLSQLVKVKFAANSVFSLSEYMRLSHKILYDGKLVAHGNWPENKEEWGRCQLFLKQHFKQLNLNKVADTLNNRLRISTKIPDIEYAIINQQKIEFLAAVKTDPAFSPMEISLTGAAEMIDNNNTYLVKNMLQGFAFSIVLISVLTWLIHRSWRWVLVFLVPNALPLLLIAGIMAWLGIELKATTSMIFSIAFGIATDDTIHFISRIKIELQYGKSLFEALKITYLQTGRAVLITSLIITAGFACMLFSDFKSNFYFGLLISITMVIAVVCDLLLLPVLINFFFKEKNQDGVIS
jgi:uncharacterized protein